MRLRGQHIPSKYFLAPINTGLSQKGSPTSELIEFHARRSSPAVGINYVGNAAIGSTYVTNDRTLYLEEADEHWKALVEAIRQGGSVPGVQVACRATSEQPKRSWKGLGRDAYVEQSRAFISGLAVSQIRGIEEEFVSACRTAIDLGFESIQIHAAHGYFVSKFLSRPLNTRSDAYGLDRTLLLQNIVDRIRDLSKDVLIDVRISFYEGIEPSEAEYEYKLGVIDSLIASCDVDLISLTNGMYDFKKGLIYPNEAEGHAPYYELCCRLANQYREVVWNCSGNIWDPTLIPDDAPENLTYSIGRSLIADPDFLLKYSQSRESQIQECTRTNKCHYFSRGDEHIRCPVNPNLARDSNSTNSAP